jgi:hypothetical protein
LGEYLKKKRIKLEVAESLQEKKEKFSFLDENAKKA